MVKNKFKKQPGIAMGEKNRGISLIVTTYNREDALELVLLSLTRQLEMPGEVIVADDGSTRATAELVERYKSRFSIPLTHCWHADDGFRLAHIRNKAIALAKFEYVIMVDGDMVLHPSFTLDHKRNMLPGRLIQGSRVLLSEQLTKKSLAQRQVTFTAFTRGLKNRFNAISCPALSPFISKTYSRKQTHAGVRGCNMSFWKSDLEKVNGFSEEFVGWGREDSEFVVRMLNSGIKRYNLKLGAVGYHLWHKENKSDHLLNQNNVFLENAIAEKRTVCKVGLNQYT